MPSLNGESRIITGMPLLAPTFPGSYASFLDHVPADMWGVMHDGARPYDGVLDAVDQLIQANKKLTILSNSSKRLDHSIRMLKRLGRCSREHSWCCVMSTSHLISRYRF
jgi:ribonucleotide monophosphatase NagD (HAD superfamily)